MKDRLEMVTNYNFRLKKQMVFTYVDKLHREANNRCHIRIKLCKKNVRVHFHKNKQI